MSKWSDAYSNHAYRQSLRDLIVYLDTIEVSDSSQFQIVEELTRLRKIITYIDGIVESLDPDLLPINTWDSVNSHLVSCLQQLRTFSNNQHGALLNANTQADSLLTYIRPYMVTRGRLGQVFGGSVRKYSETLLEYTESFSQKAELILESVRANSSLVESKLKAMSELQERIDAYAYELFGNSDGTSGTQEKVNELVAKLKEHSIAVQAFYNEILIGSADNPPIKKEVVDAKKVILTHKEDIDDMLKMADLSITRIDDFEELIYGEEVDDEDENSRVGGLKASFEDLLVKLKDFEHLQSNKYNALNKQIEDLLPGATSAGLASAYKDMKESFTEQIKRFTNLFYATIGVITFGSMWFALGYVGYENGFKFEFRADSDWLEVLKGMVLKLPFYIPALWLAFFASKRRSEYQRLQQEYAHKEALAKSYESYKQQADLLGEEGVEIKKALIIKAIDAIAYNASQTLDGKHGDDLISARAFSKSVEVIDAAVEQISKLKGKS